LPKLTKKLMFSIGTDPPAVPVTARAYCALSPGCNVVPEIFPVCRVAAIAVLPILAVSTKLMSATPMLFWTVMFIVAVPDDERVTVSVAGRTTMS
jgi:hypothetical protein